jgi:hypothetical protein
MVATTLTIINQPPTFTVIKATDTAVNKGEAYELELKSDRNQNLLAVNLEFNIKDAGISVLDVTSNKLPGFDKNEPRLHQRRRC